MVGGGQQWSLEPKRPRGMRVRRRKRGQCSGTVVLKAPSLASVLYQPQRKQATVKSQGPLDTGMGTRSTSNDASPDAGVADLLWLAAGTGDLGACRPTAGGERTGDGAGNLLFGRCGTTDPLKCPEDW